MPQNGDDNTELAKKITQNWAFFNTELSKAYVESVVLHRSTSIAVNTGPKMKPDYQYIKMHPIDMAK